MMEIPESVAGGAVGARGRGGEERRPFRTRGRKGTEAPARSSGQEGLTPWGQRGRAVSKGDLTIFRFSRRNRCAHRYGIAFWERRGG
ncbi:MAG: hypothetical protein D6812_00795 [Deltaproteobacteria bacterium]|nr:MAG: hypothetical protein D6812_00795 [Deltaproteobacteria bacterium]